MKLEDITLEKVKAAYERTGLRPKVGQSSSIRGYACLIGVLAADIAGEAYRGTPEALITVGLCPTGDDSYIVDGFDRGFSGKAVIENAVTCRLPSYQLGYNIGKALYDEEAD